MSSDRFALAVAAVMFAGGLLGLVLQRALPEHHTTGGSRDMIGAVVGLLTLLCALVTGLLIWTAYGVYSGQNTQIQTLASKIMQLDLALSDYGPEAKPARAQLREALAKSIDRVWGASEAERPLLETSARRFRTCGPGTRCWRASIPRQTSKNRRSPLRRQRPTRSLRRECRCPSRSPLPFPIRYC